VDRTTVKCSFIPLCRFTRRYRAEDLSSASLCRWRCACWDQTLASLTDVFYLYAPTARAYAVEVYVYELNRISKHHVLPNLTTISSLILNLSSSPASPCIARCSAAATSRSSFVNCNEIGCFQVAKRHGPGTARAHYMGSHGSPHNVHMSCGLVFLSFIQ
jgi:hypothetical protein